MNDVNFLEFWKTLLLRPKTFFTKYLSNSNMAPPYLTTAIFVFGIGYGIDRLNRQFVKFDFKGKLEDIEFLNNWVGFWLYALIGGIIGGYLLFYIGGWFVHLRIKWSKGSSHIENSRNIFVYASVIPSAFMILSALISMLYKKAPYEPNLQLHTWDIVSLVLSLFFYYYSIYISYSGVIATTDAEKSRSQVWFLFLPLIFITATFVASFILFIEYYTP